MTLVERLSITTVIHAPFLNALFPSRQAAVQQQLVNLVDLANPVQIPDPDDLPTAPAEKLLVMTNKIDKRTFDQPAPRECQSIGFAKLQVRHLFLTDWQAPCRFPRGCGDLFCETSGSRRWLRSVGASAAAYRGPSALPVLRQRGPDRQGIRGTFHRLIASTSLFRHVVDLRVTAQKVCHRIGHSGIAVDQKRGGLFEECAQRFQGLLRQF